MLTSSQQNRGGTLPKSWEIAPTIGKFLVAQARFRPLSQDRSFFGKAKAVAQIEVGKC